MMQLLIAALIFMGLALMTPHPVSAIFFVLALTLFVIGVLALLVIWRRRYER